MTQTAINELNSIRTMLVNQINELRSIERGIRSEFQGIGNDICASRLSNIIGRLEQANRLLNSLDTTTLATGFEQKA